MQRLMMTVAIALVCPCFDGCTKKTQPQEKAEPATKSTKNLEAVAAAQEKAAAAQEKAAQEVAEKSQSFAGQSLVGTWVCPDAEKVYLLGEDGSFSLPKKKKVGRWYVMNEALVVEQEKGKIRFSLKSATSEQIEFADVQFDNKPNFLCWTGGNYQVYATMLRDDAPVEISSESLIGLWYSAEGFDLKEDGTYSYEGPECTGGPWQLDEHKLTLKDGGCGDMTYEIAALTRYRLTMKDQAVFFRLSPDRDSNSSVKTPLSK